MNKKQKEFWKQLAKQLQPVKYFPEAEKKTDNNQSELF